MDLICLESLQCVEMERNSSDAQLVEEGRFCEGKVCLPTVHLRGFAATVHILRESAYLSSLLWNSFAPIQSEGSLAIRSSLCEVASKMVDQNSASWNPLFSWLRQIDSMRQTA